MTSVITNSIRFWCDEPSTEILRLTRDGIWANPYVPADEAAKLVLAALDINIKVLVQKAVEAEREACANLADRWTDYNVEGLAEKIRARGQS